MQSYSIGNVFSRAFALVRGSLASSGLLILLVLLVQTAFSYFAMSSLFAQAGQARPGDINFALNLFSSPMYYLTLFSAFFLTSFAMAGAVHGMLVVGHGGAATLGDCLNAAARKFLPLFALTLLWTLGVGLGWILLLVPGLILLTMWSLAVPALVGENAGIFGSFGRSRALTRGLRMNIFVTLLIFLVLYYLVVIAFTASMFGLNMAQMGVMTRSPLMMLAGIPVNWGALTAIAALLCAIYFEAVEVKEGGSSSQLNEVFG